MKAFFRKKQLMMVALVVALGAAVYLNYYLTAEPSLSAGTEDSSAVEEENLGDATFVDGPVSSESAADKEEEKPSDTDSNYFDTARKNRSAAREEALGILQEVLDNAQAAAEDKAAATAKAAAIADNVLQESHIESLVVAKGFGDCVVFIEESHCSVVVQGENLQQQETLQILEIVVSQSKVEPQNVQIMAAT